MSSNYLKAFILILAILLLSMLWVQKESAVFHQDSDHKYEYLSKEKFLVQELDVQVNKLNNTFIINYDDINRAIQEYNEHHDSRKVQDESESTKILKALGKEKLEQIDYFKRSNSIIHNSVNYIYRHISDGHFLSNDIRDSKEITQTLLVLFQLLNEYKSGNYMVLNEISLHTQKLKENILEKESSHFAYNNLLQHIDTVLLEGSKRKEVLYAVDMINNEIFRSVDRSIIKLEEDEALIHTNYSKLQNAMFFIIIVMTLLIYYFSARLINQEAKIKLHADGLEEKIEEATQSYMMQNEVYKKLFHDSSDGVILAEHGVIVDCNDAMLELLGYSDKHELINKSPAIISPEFQPNGDNSAQAIENNIQKLFTKGSQRIEWMYAKNDGSMIWTDVILNLITANDKNIIYAISRDISDRKELEEKLEATNESLQNKNIMYQKLTESLDEKIKTQTMQMLQQSRLAQMGEMISMIAHQWRQPLSAISSIAGTLSLDVIMDEYNKDFFHNRLDTIGELSQHLSRTIDDFRGFFKEEKELREISLLEIVHASLQIIGPTLKSKIVEIDEKIDENIVLITYPNEIIQVILNLLKNAEEALEENYIKEGKILINGYKEEGMSYLIIEDNAGGIPDDVAEKIFDPYFSTKMKKDGTGLGLYMSKTIIEEHCSGKLNFENTSNGSRFQIILPLNLNKEAI